MLITDLKYNDRYGCDSIRCEAFLHGVHGRIVAVMVLVAVSLSATVSESWILAHGVRIAIATEWIGKGDVEEKVELREEKRPTNIEAW